MGKFVVKFREPRETETSDAWWPKGESRECTEQEAWIRCGLLFELAIRRAPIEGAYIEYVRIHDASNEDLIYFIADPEEGGIFLGPWAEQCETIGAFRAKVKAESERKQLTMADMSTMVLDVGTDVPAFTTWFAAPAMAN